MDIDTALQLHFFADYYEERPMLTACANVLVPRKLLPQQKNKLPSASRMRMFFLRSNAGKLIFHPTRNDSTQPAHRYFLFAITAAAFSLVWRRKTIAATC